MALAPGARIGPYEVIAPLGSGGMGEVYRATDHRLGRLVAIKILPPSVSTDPVRLRRFETEARSIAELSHPNILAIFDFGREGAVVYAVLELVEGATLSAVLADGPLPTRKALAYARQIASALAAAHARGIFHRDVKPDNVMVTSTGHVMLLDFGLALRSSPDPETATLGGLTESGAVMGTPRYMAPEQARGETVDARTDIFALGAVLYEMLAGRAPFDRATGADIQAAILRDDPPPLPSHIPTSVQRVVRRCLEKSPGERFQSATDLAITIEAIDTSTEAASAPATAADASRRASRKRSIRAVATLATLVAAVAAVWALGVSRAPAAATVAPAFERVTFRRGRVINARFESGGQSIIYGATWDGRPVDVFETSLGSREIRARNVAPATLLAVSRSGDLAAARSPTFPLRFLQTGRLSVIPAEGSPRDLADDVSAADFAPDGTLAIARRLAAGRRPGSPAPWRIEWPLGHTIRDTTEPISSLRFSSNGKQLAWFEHGNGMASVYATDATGAATRLAETSESGGGLAWTPDNQVWFTGSRSQTLGDTEVQALGPEGTLRTVLSAPGGLRILDIAADGRVLVSNGRLSHVLLVDDGKSVRDVSWSQTAFLADLSEDGGTVLFWEDAPSGGDLFVRTTDGAPAIRLAHQTKIENSRGTGRLSPDKSRVVLILDGHTTILPVGAGEPRVLPAQETAIDWLPDGRHLVVWSSDLRSQHPAIIDVDAPGGTEHEQIIEGLACDDSPTVSRSSPELACPSGTAVLVGGLTGSPRRIVPSRSLGRMIAFSADHNAIYSIVQGVMPQVVKRLDLQTGQVTDFKVLDVVDPAGAWRVSPVRITADARTVAYSVFRQFDDLYIYKGVR